MEDLWLEAGVTDDQKKKEMIGKYADQDSEEEWAAFDTYKKGHSWDDFKDELIENYPEAAAAERGTPARLRQICKEAGIVQLGDINALYAFRRAFMSEARKLQEPPEAMGNRELVEMFFKCLGASFKQAVILHLGNKFNNTKMLKSKAPDGSSNATSVVRRPEDMYELKDVLKAVIFVSANSQGMFSLMQETSERDVFLFSQPVTETKVLSDKLSELEGDDTLTITYPVQCTTTNKHPTDRGECGVWLRCHADVTGGDRSVISPRGSAS